MPETMHVNKTYEQGYEPTLESGSVGFSFFPRKSRSASVGFLIKTGKKRNRNRTFLGRFLGRFLIKTNPMVSISKGSVCTCWYTVEL